MARQGVGVRLADYALAAIAASHDIVEGLAKDDRSRYGVSTGFGALATGRLPGDGLTTLSTGAAILLMAW